MGRIEERDGTVQITHIRVRYEMSVPAGEREAAERALELHVGQCPVAQTLIPCVEIEWEADIREM